MKKLTIIIGLILLLPPACWSQGQISRPSKHNSEINKNSKQSKNNKDHQNNLSTPSNQNNASNKKILDEITIHWNGASQKQKDIIMGILNNMVYIEGSSLVLGSKDDSDDNPIHQKTISFFYLNKYEVTQKEWKEIMVNNPSDFIGDFLPVENISWFDCQEFLYKLNELSGLNFRLPTEDEWEYAAQGGIKSKGYTYSGSNVIGNIGWYNENSNNHTHQIGKKLMNELGLYDMTGNVREWTSSKFNGSYFVARGGSWFDSQKDSRIKSRTGTHVSYKVDDLGMRLAL